MHQSNLSSAMSQNQPQHRYNQSNQFIQHNHKGSNDFGFDRQ